MALIEKSADRTAFETAIKKDLGYKVKYSEERFKALEVFPPIK
jgi:hypothetical protein